MQASCIGMEEGLSLWSTRLGIKMLSSSKAQSVGDQRSDGISQNRGGRGFGVPVDILYQWNVWKDEKEGGREGRKGRRVHRNRWALLGASSLSLYIRASPWQKFCNHLWNKWMSKWINNIQTNKLIINLQVTIRCKYSSYPLKLSTQGYSGPKTSAFALWAYTIYHYRDIYHLTHCL